MQQLTEEQLKQLSPEQLAELQKKQCIFCHVVAGAVASKRVYEDELVMGILDINPANPGHVLLIPKEHYGVMPQMPETVIRALARAAKKISLAMLRVFKAGGTNLFLANGVAAGQKAQHSMLHLIPRKEGDGINIFHLPKKELDEKQAAELTATLMRSIAKISGISGDAAEKAESASEKETEKRYESDLDTIAKMFT